MNCFQTDHVVVLELSPNKYHIIDDGYIRIQAVKTVNEERRLNNEVPLQVIYLRLYSYLYKYISYNMYI